MAVLTADRSLPVTNHLDAVQGGFRLHYDVEASEIIYVGSMVMLGTSGIEAADSGTEPILGIAVEHVDNSGGSAGDLRCEVLVGACWEHDVASTTIANIGDPVYASDDQTLVLAFTANGFFGVILNFISGDLCIVQNAITHNVHDYLQL